MGMYLWRRKSMSWSREPKVPTSFVMSLSIVKHLSRRVKVIGVGLMMCSTGLSVTPVNSAFVSCT